MKKKLSALAISLLFCFLVHLSNASALNEKIGPSNWNIRNLSFRALNITSNGSSLWVCGTNEAIAVSSDGGSHWQVKHQTPDGGLLLNIEFENEKFGYAAGTNGLLLTTEDAGETWVPRSAGSDTILQISFADMQHGLIRTPASLLFTADGGTNWLTVSAGENSTQLKAFPYTFSLVTLDSGHMAVMLKHGAAQYESQTFMTTKDAGKTWGIVNIPNVTLYSFLRAQGKYWAVGTEVIHKDQPGGGYAVPVALYSSDGEIWNHSTNDLLACKLEMCLACTTQGCLSANGSIANFFGDKTSYASFPPNQKLTTKWAQGGSTLCFLANQLQCTDVNSVTQASPGSDPVPVQISPPPLGGKVAQGPHCIDCEMDRILIDKKVQGSFTIKLMLEIARNGTVTNASAENAPTQEIKSQIERQAQQWLFEPYVQGGIRVNLKLNTSIRVNVIKPH
jgi:hypothetical protein